MSAIVRMECYRPKPDGSWNPKALMLTFATKTPLVVYFYSEHPVGFTFNGRTVVHGSGAPRPYLRDIDGLSTRRDDDEMPAGRVEIGRFEHELAAVVNRLFTPPHLDADTPAGIVADWLQDRGLDDAAAIVRATAAPASPFTTEFGRLPVGCRFRFPHEQPAQPVHEKFCDGAYHTILPGGEPSAVSPCTGGCLVVPLNSKETA